MMKLQSVLLGAVAFGLVGCSAITLPGDLRDQVRKAKSETLAPLVKYDTTPNVFHFDSYYVPPLDESERRLPDWYFMPERSSFNVTKLNRLMRYLQMKHGFSVEYRVGAEPTRTINGVFEYESVGDVLESIKRSTGYQYDIIDNTIVWRKYSEEIFDVRAIVGNYSYSVGKKDGLNSAQGNNQNTGGSGVNFAQAGAVTSTGDEFSNIAGENNAVDEYLAGIEAVLGCSDDEVNGDNDTPDVMPENELVNSLQQFTSGDSVDSISYSPQTEKELNGWRCDEGAEARAFYSDSSIYVKALPSQLDSVRTFVKSKTERALRTVRIDITLLTVTRKASSALNFDINVQDFIMGGDATWQTLSNASQAIVGGLTEPGSLTLSHSSGTELLIRALEERGDILQSTRIRGVAMNNRVGNFTNVDKVSFISDRKIATTSNVGQTAGIEQSVAESGVLLYMLPNIGTENVVVHISSSLSDLVTITKKGESGSEVESPEISDRIFNTMVVLEPGKPVIAGGSSVREIQAVTSKSGVSGYAQSGADQNTEILMVVEAVFL